MMLHVLLLSCSLLTGPSSAPQDETPIVDERPEVKALFGTLATHLKAKGEEDEQALTLLDKLVQEFTNSGPKDRAAIVKQFAECLEVKRPKELAEGVPDDRIYAAAAVALGTMGPESVKALTSLIGDKNHRKNMRLQTLLTLSLGKTKSPEGIKTLLGLLKHKDPPMQAAGAEALANFSEAPQDTRKQIFEEMLRTLTDQKTKKDTNTTDPEALERWNIISGPLITALQKVSGQGETDPDLWLRWWNENKKKDWSTKDG